MGGVLLQTGALSAKQTLAAAAASAVTATSYCGFPFPSSVNSEGSERTLGTTSCSGSTSSGGVLPLYFLEFFCSAVLYARTDRTSILEICSDFAE